MFTEVTAPYGQVQTVIRTSLYTSHDVAVERLTDSTPGNDELVNTAWAQRLKECGVVLDFKPDLAALSLSVISPTDSGDSELAGAYLDADDAVELAAVLMRASGFSLGRLMNVVHAQNNRHQDWADWLTKRSDRYGAWRYPSNHQIACERCRETAQHRECDCNETSCDRCQEQYRRRIEADLPF